MYKLGIDIGGTKINIGLLSEDNSIAFKHMTKVPEYKSADLIITYLKETLDSFLAENGISYGQIETCGIGIPGTVSKDGKIALKTPNLGWENEAVAEKFQNLTGLPTRLIQDSRAAAWGEYKAGGGQGKQIVVCITLGTGIGTGIVINGEIFDGALNGAGEIGHIPVVQGGRSCGCGKKGCLENYTAGPGLEMSAKEAYGQDATPGDLFERAKNKEKKAVQIINDAICMLGNGIVAIINLLSPDCLLFSGGLSSQREMLIEPLVKYIREHCYNLSAGLYIGMAHFGADAPLVGAALVPNIAKRRSVKMSASIMCADMLNLSRDIAELKKAGIDYLHFDIMDGHFVPNLMLSMDIISEIRSSTDIPFDIHLMTQSPEDIIPRLKLQKGDIVSVHCESTPHVHRALTMIKDAGADAALALNPSTPIEFVREVLADIKMVLLMTVDPRYSGQKLVAQSFEKIARLRKFLDEQGYEDIAIEVDGNCSFENVPKMHLAGADIFVLGSSSLFRPGNTILENANYLRALL